MLTNENSGDLSLKMENILLEEYKFYSAYFLQIVHERTGTYNLYILGVGLFASGLGLIYQFGAGSKLPQLPLIVTILVLVGVINLGIFIRMTILNTIQLTCFTKMKEVVGFYSQHFKDYMLGADALLYLKARSTRASLGIFSVNLSSYVFSTFTAICFGCAVFGECEFLLGSKSVFPLVTNILPYFGGIVVGVVVLLLHLPIYRLLHRYTQARILS